LGIPPGAPGYRLHADDDVRAPDATLSMVTIYALVDFTRDNGATRVIPGSHRIPSYPAKPTYPGEVSVEAPAGSCVVFTGSLWHSSGANHTDAIRTSAAAYFTVPWIKQYIDLSRSLPPEVLDRATPEARRIFGLPSRPPHTERWQWDRTTGRPHEAHRATLTARGYGTCCL
jgi:ectoine hydroxylase-related dioxygenase (phytanoyl-CoA dioxygenase family)